MSELFRKLLKAQQHMMQMKGKPGHMEQVRIVREIESQINTLTAGTISA